MERNTTLDKIESVSEAALSLDETVARPLGRLSWESNLAQHRVLAFGHSGIVPDLPQINGGFMVWLYGAGFEMQLRARMKALLPATALLQAERTKRLASLRARMAELEQREEAEIGKLEDRGFAVGRRIDVELGTVLRVWDELDANATQT